MVFNSADIASVPFMSHPFSLSRRCSNPVSAPHLDNHERQAHRRQILSQVSTFERASNNPKHALRAEGVRHRAQDVEGEVRPHGLEVLLTENESVGVGGEVKSRQGRGKEE